MDNEMAMLFGLTLVMAGLFWQALMASGNTGLVQGWCALFMLVGVVLVSSVESRRPSCRLTRAQVLRHSRRGA